MEYILKYLVIGLVIAFLTACSDFPPMTDAEAKAFEACLEKNWEPEFAVISSSRKLTCQKPSKK